VAIHREALRQFRLAGQAAAGLEDFVGDVFSRVWTICHQTAMPEPRWIMRGCLSWWGMWARGVS